MVGNVKEGSRILYNNQPIEILLEACKKSISERGEPVWYSCEVEKKFSSDLGSEDLQMYVTEKLNLSFINPYYFLRFKIDTIWNRYSAPIYQTR